MPQVVFTPNLKRHVNCAAVQVTGATVSEALPGKCIVKHRATKSRVRTWDRKTVDDPQN